MSRFTAVARTVLIGTAAAALMAGHASAQSLAGPKPADVQSGVSAGCIGDLSITGDPGTPKVADGVRASQSWSIQTVYPTPAVCSFPSARPVQVDCKRNGVSVDPVYCQEKQFQSLLAQGYRTVGNSSNWSNAQWVLPGQTDSGCVGRWDTVEGAVPQGCGQVPVDVVSSCTVTNVQSGTPDDVNKYCDPSQRPSAVKLVTDYRACGFAIETGAWGAYSNTCGDVSHDRLLTCRRQDGTDMDMSSSSCQTALGAFCSTHRCVNSGGSVYERENVALASCSTSTPGRYLWEAGGWMSGNVTCGTDTQSRSVVCRDTTSNQIVSDEFCTDVRPPSTQPVLVTSGCNGSAICTGQTEVQKWTDAAAGVDYASQCGSQGGDCVEKTIVRRSAAEGQMTEAFQSSCYKGGGNEPIAAVGPGEGPFNVHGLTVTSGTDGYCDYGNPDGTRTCLAGAYTVKGCTSGVPNVTLAMPGRVKSGSGSVSSTTAFGNADGSNAIEGAECSATSTITNNGETRTLKALGTFGSSSCMGTTSEIVGGTSYTVDVNVQVTPTSTGYELQGVATSSGVGCTGQAPATVDRCTAGSYCLLTNGGTYSNCYGNPNYQVDEYVPGGYVGVTFPFDVQAHAPGETDKPVSGVKAVSKVRVECSTPGTPTPTPDPTPAPTPTPPPTLAQSQVFVGYCRYTSSGGGRHACGEWGADYKVSGQPVPNLSEFCTGKKIAGFVGFYTLGTDPGTPPDPLGLEWQTPRAGYHWSTLPTLRDVPEAQCVVHWKQGYSGEFKNDQPGWISAYFDGPPSGKQGQTWIIK